MATEARTNLGALWWHLAAAELDVLVGLSPDNFFYATGALIMTQKMIPDRLAAVVLSRDQSPTAVVCSIEEALTRRDSCCADIRTYVEGSGSPIDLLAEVLRERGLDRARIGFEADSLPVRFAEELRAALPAATLVGADAVWARTRAIKTAAEVEILRAGARATEQAIVEAFASARCGDTEKAVADEIRCRLLRAGATDTWLTLSAGQNTSVNHHLPSSKRLEPGELVHVDCGGVFAGYYSDLSRMAAVGLPSAEQADQHRWLYEVLRRSIVSARAGAKAGEVYATAKASFEKAGREFRAVLVGHSIGVAIHELPVIHRDDPTVLQPGMALQIELGLPDGQGSRLHVEELILVTEGAPELLSDFRPADQLAVIRS